MHSIKYGLRYGLRTGYKINRGPGLSIWTGCSWCKTRTWGANEERLKICLNNSVSLIQACGERVGSIFLSGKHLHLRNGFFFLFFFNVYFKKWETMLFS